MKNKILNTAAGFIVSGVVLSIGTSLLASSPEIITRMTGVSTTLLVGSMGLFFVGLVYPKGDK